MKINYEVGDTCWIYVGEKNEKGHYILSEGTVVHAFFTPYRTHLQYIILLKDPDYVFMEIREIYTMTPDPKEWPSFTAFRTKPMPVTSSE